MLLEWTNGTSLEQIFDAETEDFKEEDWKNVLAARSNIIVLGRTVDGVIVGGFTGSALLPSSKTQTWISSPEMFIFNLNKSKTWKTKYSNSNIQVNTNTGSLIDNLIEFGSQSALEFDFSRSDGLTVQYT